MLIPIDRLFQVSHTSIQSTFLFLAVDLGFQFADTSGQRFCLHFIGQVIFHGIGSCGNRRGGVIIILDHIHIKIADTIIQSVGRTISYPINHIVHLVHPLNQRTRLDTAINDFIYPVNFLGQSDRFVCHDRHRHQKCHASCRCQ